MNMETLYQILISWAPMLILIGVWIFFMKRLRMPQSKQMEYLKRQNELMEQFVEISGRIAVSLEKISHNTKGKN